jgi:hypothetical protein
MDDTRESYRQQDWPRRLRSCHAPCNTYVDESVGRKARPPQPVESASLASLRRCAVVVVVSATDPPLFGEDVHAGFFCDSQTVGVLNPNSSVSGWGDPVAGGVA